MKSIGVIFDMDGVIVDTNPFHKKAIQQFCAKYGFNLSEEELRHKIYGRTNKEWIPNLFGALREDEVNTYAVEKEQLFRDMYEPYIKPVNGLIEFLENLRLKRIPCAIATSAPPANVELVLRHVPIRKYFSIILDELAVTHGKPHPEIYSKTAQALGLPNENCIVIEDSLSGVAAAQAAGSKVIGITTTHSRKELAGTDLVIEDFFDLNSETISKLIMRKAVDNRHTSDR